MKSKNIEDQVLSNEKISDGKFKFTRYITM